MTKASSLPGLALLAALLLGSGCHWVFPHASRSAGDGGTDGADGRSDGTPGERRPSSDGIKPASRPIRLTAGLHHTCALLEGGTILCWGDGELGQLGDGKSVRRSEPKPVQLGDGPSPDHLDAGDEHTCYVADGGVWCWGDNSAGQSGAKGVSRVLTPAKVPNLDGVTELALGARTSCALRGGGSVHCWGGSAGEPTPVSGLSNVSHLACGAHHCCALVDGAALCWGSSAHGETGTIKDIVTSPRAVEKIAKASELSCGQEHCCARLGDGSLACWGSNGVGQTGDPTFKPAVAVPFVIDALQGVEAFVAGGYHTCAVASGALHCFGYDRFGQLGAGSLGGSAGLQAVGLGGVHKLAAAGFHTCAIAGADGEQIWCWGANMQGQVGVSPITSTAAPVKAVAHDVDGLATGGHHTCSLGSSGVVQCWGFNAEGQLGDSTTSSRGNPALLAKTTGSPAAWLGIGRGGLHTCAIAKLGGNVWCWGAGWLGQLGASPKNSSVPVLVPAVAVAGATAVVGGHDHTCTLVANIAWCWGANARGQLGRSAGSVLPGPPGLVPGLPPVTAIDARNATTCAISLLGETWCWGDNSAGQLGPTADTTTGDSTKVSGAPSPATGIAVGGWHVCVVSGGKVYCWGDNGAGQLGQGKPGPKNAAPAPVPNLEGVGQVSAGWRHTCARLDDGRVVCWGLNESRQVGVATGGILASPAQVATDALEVRCGWEHTCVRKTDLTVHCWGSFHLGQLGDGKITGTAVPVRVW